MSALTRWVLAHKKVVTLFWVLLTLVGIASANSATKAMDQKFSVPGKEGWETNLTIARLFHGTGGDTAPIVPVVTVPKGTTVTSPAVRRELARVDRRLEKALPGSRLASYASTGDAALSRPMAGRPSRSSIHGPIRTPSSAKTRKRPSGPPRPSRTSGSPAPRSR